MVAQKREGVIRTRTVEVAMWAHQNVRTFVHAELYGYLVVWFFVQQQKLYTTFSEAGAATTKEPGDLDPTIVGLDCARRWIRTARKRCRFHTTWPHDFRPFDLIEVNAGENRFHPNVAEVWDHGMIRTQVFKNTTPTGLVAFKVAQHRVCPLADRYGETQLLHLEHLADAISGFAAAKHWLRNAEKALWFDHSREVLR